MKHYGENTGQLAKVKSDMERIINTVMNVKYGLIDKVPT